MISKNPPKVFIRLLSCSFYNSWQKLKRDGEISTSDDGHGNAMIEKIPSSHYTLNTIKKSSKEHFKSNSWTFSSITQRVQLSLEIYPTEMFVSIVIFLHSPDPKHENFRWDHGFQPSPSEAWNRDNLRINKMAAEIIHPTAPPHIYLPLLKGEDFRLNICDYQKELESDISHYKQVAKNIEGWNSLLTQHQFQVVSLPFSFHWGDLWVELAWWSAYHSLPRTFFLPFVQLELLFMAKDSRERFQNMRKRSLSRKWSFSQSANHLKSFGWQLNLRYWIKREIVKGWAILCFEREAQTNIPFQERRENWCRSFEGRDQEKIWKKPGSLLTISGKSWCLNSTRDQMGFLCPSLDKNSEI